MHASPQMRKGLAPFFFLALPLLAQTAQEPLFAPALLQARSPLILAGDRLSGSGAETLSRAMAESQFVLLGEDHLSREIPQFAAAICAAMHPDAYAVEAGPEATRFVGGLLRHEDRLTRMRERELAHPDSIAFLDRREENDAAEHCAEVSGRPDFQLWGLDQEFVGAAGALLDSMESARPGPRSLAAIKLLKAKERAAEERARATGDMKQLFLLVASDAEMLPLERDIEADGTPETKNLLREFLVSRRIYQMQLQGSHDASKVRAQLLKQHFMADYTRLKTSNDHPRVFFKFGGMHTGKGFSLIHQRDLGNFVAEQADLEGSQSLHILAVGVRGFHSYPDAYGKPPTPQPFELAKDPEMGWLAPALVQVLPEQAKDGATTLTLFDLRALRFRKLDLPSGWDSFIYSYDLLVLVPQFTPSTPIQ